MEEIINRNYPISSQYFPKLIENNAIYVDKTQFILPLLGKENNATYFLSRPRRFGKSLFVSALQHVFEGKKDLFKGLHIYDKINWNDYNFPVIRLSLDRIGFAELGLKTALDKAIFYAAQDFGITLKETSYSLAFGELIKKLSEKHQKRVVILVDEYDKPIVQYVEKTNLAQAEINRDILKSFYGVLKDNGEYLRFTFLTGVSKFSKVSLFSDLNQFDDLTLDPNFATICGFTEAEIRHYCPQGLKDLAHAEGLDTEGVVDKMRYWYNGFSWNAKDFVYNPFSTMLLMDKQQFDNYWFQSGTPSFLVKLINEDYYYDIKEIRINKSLYDWHDLKNLNYVSIMLQTGYLTFKKSLGDGNYIVSYPNNEVRNSFTEMLLGGYMHQQPGMMYTTTLDIEEAFDNKDIERVIKILKDMFRTLPSQFFYTDEEKTDKDGNVKIIKKAVNENFYQAVIYLVFNVLGVRMQVEVSTQDGRIDAVVEAKDDIYIFEFKKNRKAAVAIEQMKEKKYAEHYALSKKTIHLVGMSFTLQKKGISDHLVETLK
jgi:Predicted AAA-ATPase/PD-(D/E)XK nuclease superfamily